MNRSEGNPALIEAIRQRIERDGPVSFAWFMEQALYHPQWGYYSSDRCAIGREGDYFTNVSVGPTFARLIARQLVEMWERLDRPKTLVVVEQGAHHGTFARDLFSVMREDAPDVFTGLRYVMVEPFPKLRARQQNTLGEFVDRVEWRDSVEALESFAGIYFCNELFDALPVHLIKATGNAHSAWAERMVSIRGEEFAFIEQSVSDPALAKFLPKIPPQQAGYETEANLAAPDLIRRIGEKLSGGFVLAIDYGFSRADYYAPERVTGTLQCRSQHRILDSPFSLTGDADITAHVDWTTLVEAAREADLNLVGLTDQYHFFTGILAGSPEIAESGSAKERRALQTLLHPEMLGRAFQVLALSKGKISGGLKGFRFARPEAHLG